MVFNLFNQATIDSVQHFAGGPLQNESLRLRDESEMMAETRCDLCSGFGHCANGQGRTKLERLHSKCPNGWILKKRLGDSRISKQTRSYAIRHVKRRNATMYTWGVNGGGIRNGRQLGRYSQT